jgi:APA family basic amino acid/polyamine antiporter
MSQLFARKPIEDLRASGADEASLERVLGAGDLVMLAIGAVIGAGILAPLAPRPPGRLDRTDR